MYALAASAAGVSLLALAPPSEAKIVYTPTRHVIGNNGIYPLDLNHDGTIDFLIAVGVSSFVANSLVAWEAYGNAVDATNHYAAALRKGAPIGPRQIFTADSWGQFMAFYACNTETGCATGGRWVNVKNRYLGLRFEIKGKTHYGWARLSVTLHRQKITATLTGYAYETIPEKGILAGQTHGAVDGKAAVLDPGEPDVSRETSRRPASRTVLPLSLGRFALGAQGFPAWRRP